MIQQFLQETQDLMLALGLGLFFLFQIGLVDFLIVHLN